MRHCPNCGTKFTNHEAFCPYDGTPTVADAKENVDPWVGVVVDNRYRIESRIGEGGMGIVYRATHVLLNKRIAIKVVRADHAKDSDVAERFMQEARAATSIGHPNIIDINDFGRMPDGSVYFAMEHLNGGGLDELMEKGPLPMDKAIHIVEQITSALGAAHERGIVHRDLKPDNIFLIKHRDDHHFVKVLDFGIAKVAGGSSRTTRTGMVFGTPHYMSPEQAAGQSVDHRTDVYALGVMMYEMFTGQLPFDAETFMGVLTMHMYDPPPLPSQLSPQIAERIGDLEGVVLRALSKKPELRYQSMAALRDDLTAVYNEGRKSSVALDKTMIAGGNARATADTDRPPGPAPAVTDEQRAAATVHEGMHARQGEVARAMGLVGDKPASGLISSTDGSVVAPSASGALGLSSRQLWIGGAALALLAIVGVGLASRGDDSADTVKPATAIDTDVAVVAKPAPIAAPAAPANSAPQVDDVGSSLQQAAELAKLGSIEVSSEPLGAEVFHDGALLGRTPLTLPRPTQANLDVELRLDGHRATLMRITHASPERIVASLERASSKRPPSVGKAPTKQEAPTKTKTKTPVNDALREMVDPWNE